MDHGFSHNTHTHREIHARISFLQDVAIANGLRGFKRELATFMKDMSINGGHISRDSMFRGSFPVNASCREETGRELVGDPNCGLPRARMGHFGETGC